MTPGQLTPARELLGAMLLQMGKPTEALAAFEATMRKEPNRLNATLGAAGAAVQNLNLMLGLKETEGLI